MFLRIDFTISFTSPSFSLPLSSACLSLLQMYDNVKSLRLVPEGNHTFVTAMISSEGEVLEFRHHRKYTALHRAASHHAPAPASAPSLLLHLNHCSIPTH